MTGSTLSIRQALVNAKAEELRQHRNVVKGVIVGESLTGGSVVAGVTYALTGDPMYTTIGGMAGFLFGGFFAAVKGVDLALRLASGCMTPDADIEKGMTPGK